MRANKKDSNQKEIEKELIKRGIGFLDTSSLKKYTFDLVILYNGAHIMEIKNPEYFPKYFSVLPEDEKYKYIVNKLTDEEKKTMKKCKDTNTNFNIVWDLPSTLKAIGYVLDDTQ